MSKKKQVPAVVVVEDNSDQQKTIVLKSPIPWGSETITEIVLNEPDGDAIWHMGKDLKFGELMAIASKCSGHPHSVFKKMKAKDTFRIAEAVGDFLDDGQETGNIN